MDGPARYGVFPIDVLMVLFRAMEVLASILSITKKPYPNLPDYCGLVFTCAG